MDFRRHVTAGRLAELFGPSQVATDAFLRTLGWRHVAEQELPLLAPETREYLEAYAAGVNEWITATGGAGASGAKSLEYSVLGLQNSAYEVQPWTPVDSLAWLKAMAWDLRGNMESEIARGVLFAHGLTRARSASSIRPTRTVATSRSSPACPARPRDRGTDTGPLSGNADVPWNDVAPDPAGTLRRGRVPAATAR